MYVRQQPECLIYGLDDIKLSLAYSLVCGDLTTDRSYHRDHQYYHRCLPDHRHYQHPQHTLFPGVISPVLYNSVRCAVMTMKATFSAFLLSICSINSRSYFDSEDNSDRRDIFRPSVELSQLNTSTISVSSLPMQPLSSQLRPDSRAEERLAISFDEEYADIGNIDYTLPSVSSYRGERGIQGEEGCGCVQECLTSCQGTWVSLRTPIREGQCFISMEKGRKERIFNTGCISVIL